MLIRKKLRRKQFNVQSEHFDKLSKKKTEEFVFPTSSLEPDRLNQFTKGVFDYNCFFFFFFCYKMFDFNC